MSVEKLRDMMKSVARQEIKHLEQSIRNDIDQRLDDLSAAMRAGDEQAVRVAKLKLKVLRHRLGILCGER